MRLDQRSRRREQDKVGLESDAPAAVVEPRDVAPAVDAKRPVLDEGVCQFGKEALQNGQAGRQEDMHMTSLRHALARLRSPRQAVPLHDCHMVEVVGKHPRSQQAGHARAGNHGVAERWVWHVPSPLWPRAGVTIPVRTAPRGQPGEMVWLTRNMLAGSSLRFNSISRASISRARW
jgi:hypothetical protein